MPPRKPPPRRRPPESERDRAERRGQEHGKRAGWGSVARKGAGKVGQRGGDNGSSKASDAFREAAGSPDWEPDHWIDEGSDPEALRRTAGGAVGRARRAPSGPPQQQRQRRQGQQGKRRFAPPGDDAAWTLEADIARAVGPGRAKKIGERVAEAVRAFERGRYDDARRALKPLAEQAPQSAAIRELHGLALYRSGRWKEAARELEAYRALTASVDQHPVLADCYRALQRYPKVRELWEELREASPSADLVAEGRIVLGGALADQGDLVEAIKVLEASPKPSGKAKVHHLRVAYALADLHERAGDIPRARELFTRVAASDEDFADVRSRLAALD
jgi:thioredoxin-like negative regulator of GroEL